MWIEAESSGFILPGLDAAAASELIDRGPGWSAAVLFLHQAQVVAERLEHSGEVDLAETAAALAESFTEPIWHDLFEQLPRVAGCGHVRGCEELLPAAVALETERRDLREVPYIGVLAADHAGEATGEALSWLFLCAWALNASLHPERVIGCFGEEGAVAHLIGEGEDLDRFLLRSFLNDVPLLQCAPELVEHLPRRAEEWVFADAVSLSALEAALPHPSPEDELDPQPWPREGWLVRLGEWEIRFAPVQRSQETRALAMGIARTPAGCFLLEVFVGEDGHPSLQPLPLRYCGEELGERVELLEERLEAALRSAPKGKAGNEERPREGLL